MTEEQKKKMADGRRRAMEARAQATEQTVSGVEQAIPAGHVRNEALHSLRDDAVQNAETLESETGAIPLDPAKLDVKNVDNEIAAHWNPERGDIPFSHPQEGYQYAWVTHGGPHSDQAQTSIRAMHSRMERVGWHKVDGNMPEGKEFIGKDCASATSMRGVGDTFLWRIRREDWARVEDANRRKELRDQGIETEFAHRANSTGVTRALGDDMMSRVYGAERMRPVAYSAAFNENQIRSGNGPLPPGFELRGRR